MGSPELYNVVYSELSHLPEIPGFTTFKHLVTSVSVSAGIQSDQVRFVLVLLAFIPLGFLFRLVPGITLKNIYCLALGMLGTWTIMGPNSLNVLVSSTLVYIYVYFAMPTSPDWDAMRAKSSDDDLLAAKKSLYARRRQIGVNVFIFSMAYMCISHIYRYFNDYLGYRLDFTAAQMLLTIKLSAYAWNRVDGETMNDGLELDDIPRTQQYRVERAIRSTPSYLQYCAWMYHFTSCIAGPSLDYREYEMYLDGSLWKQYGLQELPSSLMGSMKKLGAALLSYPGVAIMTAFSVSKYVGTDSFLQHYPSLWQRMAYIIFFTGFSRFKYYFAWYLAESASVATGIGISGYDKSTGEVSWERCNGARAWLIECTTSTDDLINNWNIRCSEWLKYYVFRRVELPGFLQGKIKQRDFANIVTKFTSAFWHGVYPGYYVFFFQVYLMQLFEGRLRRILLPLFSEPNPDNPRKPILLYPRAYIYNIIMNCFVLWSFSWIGSAFVLLEFWPTIMIQWDSCFVYQIGGYILLILIPDLFFFKKRDSVKAVDGKDSAATKAADEPTDKPKQE